MQGGQQRLSPPQGAPEAARLLLAGWGCNPGWFYGPDTLGGSETFSPFREAPFTARILGPPRDVPAAVRGLASCLVFRLVRLGETAECPGPPLVPVRAGLA